MQYYPQQPPQYPTQLPYGQPYQPYPQQPYVQQPYVQPYAPIPPAMSPEEQIKHDYKRRLKRCANSIGALLLIFFGLQTILALMISLISSGIGSDPDDSVLFMLENGVASLLIFFLSALIYCLIKKADFSKLFPFHKVGASMLFKLSVIGLSFSLMSNYVVDLLNNTFSLFGIENTGGTFDTGSHPNILLYFLTVAVLPAFAEEFAFRGVIMGTIRPYSEGLAILVSSATFALMHGNFVQLPFTFCCGIVFAYIDIKTGSLLPSIIIHFLNNGLSVLFDVLTSYGVLNDYGADMYYGIIFAVTGILSMIFLFGIIRKGDGSQFRLSGGNDTLPFKTKVKTVSSSPTLIVFTVLMTLNCVLTMFPDILTGLFKNVLSQ